MRPFRFGAIAAGVYVLDQATKWAVVRTMPLNSIAEVAPFFSFMHVRNTGAAFGIYQDGNAFFIVTTLAVLTVLSVLHKKLVDGLWMNFWGVALLWGGALGNLTDRLRLGAVTDFLDVFVGQWHWPAFNVADAAICTGVGLLILSGFRTSKAEAPAHTQ